MITYYKLKEGGFGLRGPADEVVPGRHVKVRTKAGADKDEQVGPIFWSGKDDEGNAIVCAKKADKTPNQQNGDLATTKQLSAIDAMLRKAHVVCPTVAQAIEARRDTLNTKANASAAIDQLKKALDETQETPSVGESLFG